MCGIYLTNLAYNKKSIVKKLNRISYRGPDYLGIEQKDSLIFGHLRLAILDLDDRSNQPMSFNGKTIVFNGEIYNYLEIREELISEGVNFVTESDTEVLLKAYDFWGESFLEKLNGMFAFSIYDSKRKVVFSARDRIGVKPFYYYWDKGKFEICSQLQPIHENKEIDWESVSIYLNTSYIPAPKTIFKNVYKLKPGSWIRINLENSTKEIGQYWSLGKRIQRKIGFHQAKDELHDLLKDAVRIRLNSDVPTGCFLSGGIDSALVSSIASNISKKGIKTFTIGFKEEGYDESQLSRKFAAIIGSEHEETICSPNDVVDLIPHFIKCFDEPFGDSSALPSLLLNQEAKRYVTVALSGDGGDESFLGYNTFRILDKIKFLFVLPIGLRKVMSKLVIVNFGSISKDSLKKLMKIETINDIIFRFYTGNGELLKKETDNWKKDFNNYKNRKNIFQKLADLTIELWLPNDSNTKVDRASMFSSVEVRSPFLDYRVVEFARSLPVNYRYKNGRSKIILREILKEYIPEEEFNVPKKGFSIPIGKWIKQELKNEFEENLSKSLISQIPNLNVDRFHLMYKDHINNKKDYSSYIWRVYVLSKWLQNYGHIKPN